jgi:cytoskeleton-associated protein 5
VAAAAKAGPAAAAGPAARKPAPAAATAASAAPSSRPSSRSDAAPKALAPKNGNAARSAGAAKPPAARARPAAAEEDDAAAAAGGRISAEEAESRMTDQFGAATVEAMRSPKWQERLDAVAAVADATAAALGDADAASLVACLAHLPGWGEKHFQVVNRTFELLAALARGAPGFGRREASIAVEGLGERLHELKHRLPAGEALTAAAEAAGPQFVAAQLHARAAAHKNPKVLSESLAWIAAAVDDFGLGAMELGALLAWTTAALASPTAPVRNQAMAVLGRCHAQVGGGLLAQLDTLKPAQLTALEEIFRKNPLDAGYAPRRRVRPRPGRAAAAGGGGGGGGGGGPMEVDGEEEGGSGGGGVSLEDLLPRADISAALAGGIVDRIGSANWKERNAALEDVEALLREAGGRVAPELPADLFPALRARFADTNRNLAAKALLLLGKLAAAVGAPFDRAARPVLAPALGCLADNKKQVRDAVLAMLEAWEATCPADRLFPAVADAAANPKCVVEGRVAALGWMARVLGAGRGERCAPAALRAAVTAALDKAAGVRDAGSGLLAALAAAAGPAEVAAAAAALDAAQRKAAEPMVSKALAAAAAAAPPLPPAAAAAAPPPPAAAAGSVATSGIFSRGASASTASSAGGALAPAPPRALPSGSVASALAGGAAPLLCMASGKAQRAARARPRQAKFEPPAAEELEALEAALGAAASDDFRALLFSRDFRDHVRAAEALAAALPALLPEAVASLDLLLRWAVARLCEGNMQSLLAVLEALRALLAALAAAGYQLSEAEAAALLPAIVDKSGHNLDRVRALHRDVLRACAALHPAARVLEYVAAGLASKNSRTRVECCDEVAAVAAREGAGPVAACRAKPMPIIAAVSAGSEG